MTTSPRPTKELDCLGMKSPAPMIAVAREAMLLREQGGTLIVEADDPVFRLALEAWMRSTSNELTEIDESPEGVVRAVIRFRDPQTLPDLESDPGSASASSVFLDLRGVQSPGPIIALARLCSQQPGGTELRLIADDPAFSSDLRSWLQAGRAELLELENNRSDTLRARLRVSETAAASSSQLTTKSPPNNRCTLLVLHDDREALLGALLVATTAAAQGMQTSLFFTLSALHLLRGDDKDTTPPPGRIRRRRRLAQWLMANDPVEQDLGKRRAGPASNSLELPELLRCAQDLDVTFTACTMSMDSTGISPEELRLYPKLEFAGMATYIERARHSSLSLVF